MPRTILILLATAAAGITVIKCNPAEETFRECLISEPQQSLGHCFGVGAISKLQSLDSEPEFDLIDGVTFTKDQQDQEYKASYNHAEGRDPADFRYLVDSLGQIVGQRTMVWDMSTIYPGLTMRVAPSVHPAGMLEFVLDPRKEILNKHALKEAGTGRLLARQFIVPLLLGTKFNVASLIPLLFGLLALLAKKAVFVSKIALIASSAYGLSTLLMGNGNKLQYQHQNNHYNAPFNPGFGGHYNRYQSDGYHQDVVYRGIAENNVDQLRLYDNHQDRFRKDAGSSRNFAWTSARDAQNNNNK